MGSLGSGSKVHVAIVGGGITGLALAVGLAARNVPYTIYERAAGPKEVGAGIGLSPNAERSMAGLDPKLLAAYNDVATPNGADYFQWVDGVKTNELVCRMYLGKDAFRGCRRADLLESWLRLVPKDRLCFNKQVDTISDREGGRVSLAFTDGSTAEADVGKTES